MANRNKKVEKKYRKQRDTQESKKRMSDGKEKDDFRKSDRKDEAPKRESWNKAEWYIPDPKIREQVASYAVNTTTGIPEVLEGVNSELSYDSKTTVLYGDVMSISLFPYPGTNALTNLGNGVSALDTACRKLYTAISSVNSKTTQYTPESLGIAIIAVGELISLISYAVRAYGVAFTYNPRNRRVPERIINAMGLTSSILDDLPNFRMQLNKLITAANNIRMLKDLKYFTKCWEIYANYFEDASSGLAQYYVMRPAGYLKYMETSPTTGELEWVPFPSTPTLSHLQLINHIQTCLNNLLTSSLMNYVYTDIVNYVTREGGELLGFSYIGELYTILPIQDLTFLTQVHNMTWGMFDLVTTPYKIYEDPLTLTIQTTDIFNHSGTANQRLALATDRIIDFPFSDNPSVDDKIDAIAYTTIVWDIDSNGDPTGIAAPDHPVLEVVMFRSDTNIRNLEQCIDGVSSGNFGNLLNSVMVNDTFSVSPLLYVYIFSSSGQDCRPIGNLNYFTRMRFRQLKNIQDYSFLGLFDAEVKSVKPF